ncbi:MAG TPA: hypothetical protein VJP77_07780 [Planctomycetota bacterium]|nr:hypothetical protein [Planctomycetota bacterium]
MAFIHGKDTYISLNAVDLSAFVNTSELSRSADSHDVTTYGKSDHVYRGGLGDGKATMAGIYDDGAAGPRATIEPLIGTVVELVRRPEGTGATKPEDTVDVLVMTYVETNPVADMVAWSCEMQLSDAVVTADQV